MFFATLQQIGLNNTRKAESVEYSGIFFSDVQRRAIESTKPEESVILKAADKIVQCPEGQKIITEGLVMVGKALYNSFSKCYK